MPTQSIWLAGHGRQYEALRGEERADVAVVGAGAAGLTAAYLLAAAGVGVAVLEARTIGSGASGTAAQLTSQRGLAYDKWLRHYGQERARLLAQGHESAIRLAAGIVQAEEIECGFAQTDSFVFTQKASREAALEAEAEAASALGVMADITSGEPFLFPYAAAVRFRRQAALNPVGYLDGLARAVKRSGGCVHEMSRALEVTETGVATAEGFVKAKCTIVTTGFPIVNIPGWYPMKMGRRSYCAAAFGNAQPFAGMWASADRGGYSYLYREKKLILAETEGTEPDGATAARFDTMRKYAFRTFPDAMLESQWTAQAANTVDGLPYAGRYAERAHSMFVAAGFGRWGLAGAMLAGHILCDLVLDKKNPYAELFSPQRALKKAAWGSAVALNLNTAWLLASSTFRKKGPVCSHYGCRLNWNHAEETWDCPCHGSRFDGNGNVLESPAIKPIHKQ